MEYYDQLREQFFLEYAQLDVPEVTKRQVTSWWKRISKAEKEFGKRIEEGYTVDDWRTLLLNCSVRSVPTLISLRVYLKRYLKYLRDKQIISEDCITALESIKFEQLSFEKSECSRLLYYRNIAELHDAVMNTIQKAEEKFPERDPVSYLPHIAYTYLLWYGLSNEQIVSLKKSEVTRNGVTVDGRLIMMPDYVTDVLIKYRDSDGYTQQAKGKITLHYLPSDYLFRSYRKEQLNEENLIWFLHNFNSLTEKQSPLSPAVIRKSGNFYRYYMAECEALVTPVLTNRTEAEQFFGTKFSSDKDWQNFVREYKMFKKLYQ